MPTQEFSLPTTDGVTQLHGDLITPSGLQNATGALLMVPGGGFTERDGFLGDSYTEADLMFRRIANRVVDSGLIVARHDNRGVTGHELSIGPSKDSPDPQGDTERYFASCVDFKIRRTVTPESLIDDAELAYQFTTNHPKVDATRIVVFAHSEAGIHVCRLIDQKRIAPHGVILAGTPVGSPVEILRWQMIDRYVDEVMSWDSDADGLVSSADVSSSYGESFLIEVGLTEDDLTPPDGQWSRTALKTFFTARYEEAKAKALNTSDESGYPHADDDTLFDFVMASNRWWKQWFIDDRSTLGLLRNYQGHLSFHFGEIDRQFSAQREVDSVTTGTASLFTTPQVTLHESRGHAFASNKPISGPMDMAAEDIFVAQITSMLQDN